MQFDVALARASPERCRHCQGVLSVHGRVEIGRIRPGLGGRFAWGSHIESRATLLSQNSLIERKPEPRLSARPFALVAGVRILYPSNTRAVRGRRSFCAEHRYRGPPAALINAVTAGEAVLFLGAGASVGAIAADGTGKIPGASELRDRLSDKFLGGRLKDRPLAVVAQISESEVGLLQVQLFIRDQFVNFGPAPFHLLVSEFRWHGIATTNYDLIVEKAFTANADAQQQLVPFYKNLQLVEHESKQHQHPLQFLNFMVASTISTRVTLRSF